MEESYFDYLPDDIVVEYILNFLNKDDVINLIKLENFEHRSELLKRYIHKNYGNLYNKKFWYHQTWYYYLMRLLSSQIIPIIYGGDIIDYIPFLKSSETDYIINPEVPIINKVLAFLSRLERPAYTQKAKYIGDAEECNPNPYNISILMLVKNNKIVDATYPQEGTNIFTVVELDVPEVPVRLEEPEKPPSRGRKLTGKIGLIRNFLMVGSYRIEFASIQNGLFSRLSTIPIYAYQLDSRMVIIDYQDSLHDFRLVQRGKVCETFERSELLELLIGLGILANPNIKKSDLCEEIKKALIELGHYYEF